MAKADIRPITVYLPGDEIEALQRESDADGRSGVSSQIRWILQQRRLKSS